MAAVPLLLLLFSLLSPVLSISVVVGPIIGKVTDTTARIVIELDTDASVTAKLVSETGGTEFTIAAALTAFRPFTFKFHSLTPAMRYTFTISQTGGNTITSVTSKFRTLRTTVTLEDKPVFITLACNRIVYTNTVVKPKGQGDVWEEVAKRAEAGTVTYMFHIGDQIYTDDWAHPVGEKNTLVKALELVEPVPIAQRDDALRAQVQEMWRQVFHDTFGHEPTRRALANAPNLMIYDDHEFADDLGDVPAHRSNATYQFIFAAARPVVMMYERELWEDTGVELVNSNGANIVRRDGFLDNENHMSFQIGEIGFLFVDTRGAKFWKPVTSDPTPYITSPQWDDIVDFIDTTVGMRMLFVLTQIPMVLFDDKFIEATIGVGNINPDIGEKVNDLLGLWEYKDNQKEQVRMLDTLLAWMNRNSEQRRVIINGGDMHLAGYTHIEKDDEVKFPQLAVGPASGDESGVAANKFLDLLSLKNDISNGWEFEHYKWKTRRNAGIQYVDPTETRFFCRSRHLMSNDNDTAIVEREPEQKALGKIEAFLSGASIATPGIFALILALFAFLNVV